MDEFAFKYNPYSILPYGEQYERWLNLPPIELHFQIRKERIADFLNESQKEEINGWLEYDGKDDFASVIIKSPRDRRSWQIAKRYLHIYSSTSGKASQ